MPPNERQASAIPDFRFFARIPPSYKHKKTAPISSSGKKPAQPDRCETMQQVLEYLSEAGRLDVLEQRRSRRQLIRISERDVESPISSRRTVDRAVGIVLPDGLCRVIERN